MDNNIFDYATSELSQDAVLCWLIKWADQQYAQANPQMHNVGRLFLQSLINRWSAQHNMSPMKLPQSISINIIRQYRSSDILVIVKNLLVIQIEDKIDTGTHSNQLLRYKETIKNDAELRTLPNIYAYFKPRYFIPDKKLIDSDYAIFDINAIQFLPGLQSDNIIFNYFKEHIDKYINSAATCETAPIHRWSWGATEKFYCLLADEYGDMEGGYVNSPGGGFLGCWWGHIYLPDNIAIYLQIETSIKHPVNSYLCFKISGIHKNGRFRELRSCWFSSLVTAAKTFDVAIEKSIWRKGKTMTVAKLKGDLRCTDGQGRMSYAKTLKRIDCAVNILCESAPIFRTKISA